MKVLAVTNIYPNESHPAQGTFIEQQVVSLRRIGVDVSVLFVNRRIQGAAAYRSLPRLLRSRLADFDADLVHVMYGGVMADLVTRVVQDRPTVVTFHGSDLLGENLSGIRRKVISKYGVIASRRAAKRAAGVIVVAKALRDRLPASVDRARVRIIPCGIDLARFKRLDESICRQALEWRRDRFHVLFNSSGGDPVKRQGLARSAVEILSQMGVPAEFHELRGLSNDEVPRWVNASHVLLLTSLHEGSPTIVKEALACDLPVVSVDVGDVLERIQGVEGCHIAVPNSNDLAAKLQLVFRRGGKIDARSRMEEVSLERIAQRLDDFYGELVRPRDETGK